MTPKDFSFVVTTIGEISDIEKKQYNILPRNIYPELKQLDYSLRQQYDLAHQLTPVQWLLVQRRDEVDVLNHPWTQVWATINQGIPHVWIATEFIVETKEDKEAVIWFSTQVGGILWLLCEDPREDGKSMQYEVDVDVLGKTDKEIQKIMDEMYALLNPNFEYLINIPM